MCGIAGLFHLETPKPVDPVRIEGMTDALAHRGPDGAGVWTGPGVGLGHRRLSIIDLAGSPQPMSDMAGRAVIVFNGEIYNYRALREELGARGHLFRTQGDTETILAAWAEWGPACLERLHGMFAFALYDIDTRRLFLARDRLGVKPLFLARLSDGSMAFASELKGLLAHPLLRREPDPLAVADYLAWGYVPDHRCIVAGVVKLPAGHWLMLECGKAVPQPVRWWTPDFRARARGSTDELALQLRQHLRDAVASRMVADVPLGAFLSGGVDSSAVVAMMSAASSRPVISCSIGFDSAALDESAYAAQVARQFGAQHHALEVDADDFDLVDRLAGIFDEPFADASALPMLQLCTMARRHVTVALSGDGADEAFAGYRRQVFQSHEERARRWLPGALRSGLLGPLGAAWPQMDWAPRPLRLGATLRSLARDGGEGYAAALAVTDPATRAALTTEAFARAVSGHRPEAAVIDAMAAAPADSPLDRAIWADLKIWLPGDILTKVDRTSMAVGLEAREPLLDHRLVEFAASLPDALRVRGRQGKWLMKKALEPLLPRDILYRPKMGFVAPLAEWLRGPLAGEARAIAGGSALARTGWFDGAAIARLAEAHIAGQRDHSRTLWQLLMLDRSLARLFALG